MAAGPETIDQRLEGVLDNADAFFMKAGRVHRTAEALTRRLAEADIPYAIAGAMALGVHAS